ncbi:MAG TPA: TRAP transporter substrate-binding protein [Xanthobacteraceae bacterium]|jgi:tripartite ATP-independent transporter DctP family solute receptor|nr:TRAP transporter substrate-binding protein [Xanthobacteraceae bacterium]
MAKITRRNFLQTTSAAASGVAAFGILTRPGDAAEITWRYANNNVEAHPVNIRLREAVEKIRQESSGRMEVQLFPNNQLGGDTDMLSQLRTGAIQLFNLSGLILSTFVPVASINGIGFAFQNYNQVWSAMDGALGAYVRGGIEKAGLFALEKMWDNGYRQVTSSSHPINSPDDFKGFKIRVPVSPLWTSMFKAFGASPASINFAEVYSALQTKIVEGQENPLALISLGKFYEVQKYVSVTNHMWDGFWTLSNGRAWAALPKDLQEIVARNINQAALKEREDVRKLNDTLRGELTQKGMIFNETSADKFRATLREAKFYAEWKEKYGAEAWAVLEKQVGALS